MLIKEELSRYENFCSTNDVRLHTLLFKSFFIEVTGLEIVLTIILFKLFFKELEEQADKSVYCKK